MTGLTLWKDREIDKMKRDIDRLMSKFRSDFGMPLFAKPKGNIRIIDVSETEDQLMVKADITGIRPEDMELSISGEVLTIKGKVQEKVVDKGENYRNIEKSYTSFTRTLLLPCKVVLEDVEAVFKDNILLIMMPKCKPGAVHEVKIKIA